MNIDNSRTPMYKKTVLAVVLPAIAVVAGLSATQARAEVVLPTTDTQVMHKYGTKFSAKPVAASPVMPTGIPAFPGAEGFGSRTTGGRGGDVVYVTNLNDSGAGSLNDAFGYANDAMNKPRYILFKVSGVVNSVSDGSAEWDRMTHIQHGNFTYAGHSSTGGVIVKGISGSCFAGAECEHNNMIFRHIKSRPDGLGQDDAFRITQSSGVIVDHASFSRASDEVMQIGYNSNYTIQNSILAETTGEHYNKGGLLLKYSSRDMQNTNISFHHNMFHRIGGRLPQIGCADFVNELCEAPYEMDLEVSYNLIWDPASFQLLKDSYLDPYGQKYGLKYNINFVNNYMYARDTYTNPMFSETANEKDELYYSGNKMNLYPEYQDLELMYCCNSFNEIAPNTNDLSTGKVTSPHSFPALTHTDGGAGIVTYMMSNAGAFPRDAMDRRYMASLASGEIDDTHWSVAPVGDAHVFDWVTPPPPYLDSDDDGMPDDWEICNGLDPLVQDHNGGELSLAYTGITGYDNLEVYLNRLSDNLVDGVSINKAECVTQPFSVSAMFSNTSITLAEGNTVTLTVSSAETLSQVIINTDQIIEPTAFPSPASIDITASESGGTYSYVLLIPESRDGGEYQVSVRAKKADGSTVDLTTTITII